MLQAALQTDQPSYMTLEHDSQRLDADAVEALMRAHQGELLCYARSFVRDEEVARDIVQETFIKLWKKPPEPRAVRAWLYRVCRSCAIDHWRRHHTENRHRAEMSPELFAQRPDRSPTPAQALLHRDDKGTLFAHLATMPERQQELLRLKFQAGLSYKEIAEATGLTVTNVGFILHTALTALKNHINANHTH